MVSKPAEDDSDGQMQLTDDEEEDLCRVWDMAMDKVGEVRLCLTGLVFFCWSVIPCILINDC